MIKQLLAYQEKEKERLAVVMSVEAGKTKRELDEAAKQLDTNKRLVLTLDNDAQRITDNFNQAQKTIADITKQIEQVATTDMEGKSEKEISAVAQSLSALFSKLNALEKQIVEMKKQIETKFSQFEEARVKLARIQKIIQTNKPAYEQEKSEIADSITKFDKELAIIAKDINKELVDRYKKKRAQDKAGRGYDIVVKLTHNRCGGCHFELPLSMIHKIETDGYIICEECGKIIYKA